MYVSRIYCSKEDRVANRNWIEWPTVEEEEWDGGGDDDDAKLRKDDDDDDEDYQYSKERNMKIYKKKKTSVGAMIRVQQDKDKG